MNKYIDHTLLKPIAQKEDIEKLCKEAIEYNFASVCVNPCNVKLAKKMLLDTDVLVCTVIGFPLGANTIAVKAFETKEAYENGCDEFDMVINIGMLKDKQYDYVLEDIKAVVREAKGKTVKVIIETGLLTDSEKAIACELATKAKADFVKTCTGVSEGKAKVEDILLMKANISKDVKIKASSGIRSLEDAKELINAGASRIGTSSGIAIMKGKE